MCVCVCLPRVYLCYLDILAPNPFCLGGAARRGGGSKEGRGCLASRDVYFDYSKGILNIIIKLGWRAKD